MRFDRVPKGQWPSTPKGLKEVFLSSSFLVQIYDENGTIRLSVNRTGFDGERWHDGISWDELQAIKNAIGFADHCAVEIYPPANNVVNVANIRHLWVLDEPPAFMWGRNDGD